MKLVVDEIRAPAALRIAQDADAPAVRVGRATAQRVLAYQRRIEHQVDVRARGPSGERSPGGVLEAHRDDTVGEDIAPGDHEIGLEFFYFEFRRASHISEFLSRDEAGESRHRGDIHRPKGRGGHEFCPFEILLVNSAGDEAATRMAMEAAGNAFSERPALQVWCLAISRLRRTTSAPSIPALPGREPRNPP